MIEAPGIYSISAEEYHSDPAPKPSLSSSGIKRLLSGSPAEFAAHHPALTRWPELLLEPATRSQELGAIAHAVVLGEGARYVVGDPSEHMTERGKPSETWGSKAASAWKAEQEAAGRIVINQKNSARAETAAQAMKDLIAAEYGDWPLGESEQTIIWQAESSHGFIWCRAMLDHLSKRHFLILDPKFTDLGIDDRSLQKKAASEMWHIQQAWYIEAVESLAADLYGRLTFRFPIAQLYPPYQARFVDLPESWIHVARARIDRAADLFALCLKNGEWPGHEKTCSPQPPDWLTREFEEEELQ